MAIRSIRKEGDEILRKRSKEVENIDDRIKELFDDMLDTLKEYDGIGIAAVQVGVLKRMIIVDLTDVIEGENPIRLINPVITKSKGEQTAEEGCLSIPNKYANVIRPSEITVEALNENGEKIKIEAKEIMAVVLSHEIDHLEGDLFIDKMVEGTLEVVTPEQKQEKKDKRKVDRKK